jgi:hypothetical protein
MIYSRCMNTKSSESQNQTTLLTTKQLLARIPVCKRTLDNWKARGLLPYIKVGGFCLYDWDRVQATLRANERGGTHPVEPWVSVIRGALQTNGHGGKQ